MVDKFTAANPAISDYYGISVSMGVNYAAVGCPYSDDGASYTGNAFIYYPVDSSWELKTNSSHPISNPAIASVSLWLCQITIWPWVHCV
jgi:hypothetical protein